MQIFLQFSEQKFLKSQVKVMSPIIDASAGARLAFTMWAVLIFGGHQSAPLLQQGGHVGGEFAGEVHFLACAGMAETEGAGVEGLTRTNIEAVMDKGAVGGGAVAAQNFLTAVAFVVEERVSEALHVDADLVGTPRFQSALDEGDMPQAFQHAVVSDGGFARRVVVGQDGHLQTVFGISPDVAAYGAFVLGKGPPDEGVV